MAKFWWRQSTNSTGIHCFKWKRLTKPKKEGGLGFRDIESFNLALLGKNIWRVLQAPQSLLAKTLKAKYFRRSSILQAKLGSRPSFAWRSLHSVIPLVRSGIRKDIGNGKDTSLWEEPWLPSVPARPPRRRSLAYNIKESVNSLVISSTCQWNWYKIEQLIHPEDIKWVRRMSPPKPEASDGYIWIPSKTGEYSTKTGFWMHYRQSLSSQDPSNHPNLDPLFESVWRLKTTPKIKHFLWRVISNAIPVLDNMSKRKLTETNICPTCGEKGETVNHLLFNCPFARLVWSLSNFPGANPSRFNTSIYSNLSKLLWFSSSDVRAKERQQDFPWILWGLWKARNDLYYKNRKPNAEQLVSIAQENRAEWFSVNSNTQTLTDLSTASRSSQNLGIPSWKPPKEREYLCNVDGAWSSESSFGFIGWILRDHKGDLCCWGSKKLGFVESAFKSELEGILWVVRSVKEKGYQKVTFVSDCKQAIEVLEDRETWLSVATSKKAIDALRSEFELFRLVFHPRTANRVADLLAKHAKSFTSFDSIISSSIPLCISDLIWAGKSRHPLSF